MDNQVTVSRYVSDTGETFTQTLPQQVVAMILKPTAMAMGESAQRMQTVRYSTQDMALCAAHSEKWVRWLAPIEMLTVALPQQMLLSAAYEMNRPDGTDLAVTPQFADLRVLHLMKALEAESDFGFRSGRLYLDSMRPGEPPEQREAELQLRERFMLQPAQQAVNASLANLGYPALPHPILEAVTALADLYLHPGIESFEYPDPNSKVQYIGALPTPAGQPTLPEWWQQLDRTKRLVLVTQGTIANRDFGQVVAPTLVALGGRKDVTIIVTTGGQPIESIPVAIPSNARIISFLPYTEIMPEIDLLITNGGYGTVNMAISHGIPVISAGLTEDKEEVSAHVQWSGAGIDLRTDRATPEAIRHAVDEIFTRPGYRDRAQQFSIEFANHDVEAELLSLIEECIPETVGA